jgi:N-acetylglucosamine-6-phosphate deacetylase
VRFIRDADLAEFHRWQACSDGLVGIVTIAPESPRATEYIEAISKVGVVVAIGHTAASGEQIRAAVRSGARMSTHLGNGAHTVLPRHPNYIWTQLADDRLVASFIADGQHLPSDTLSAMLRAKGLDRSILVSDSVSMAGMPPGDYQPSVGGAVTVEADGRVRLAGTPYLAGSGFSLLACVNWATANVLLAPEVALLLATVNPARMLGHETRAVSDPLRPCSDFVILAEGASGFVVQCTVINGRVVFPGSRLIDR